MSKTKYRITLQNICLVNVPTRLNRMFLKIKNCVSTVITKSYPITNNKCEFTDPIHIDVNFPSKINKIYVDSSHHLKVKPLRFSFRLENQSKAGFQRYGVAIIDLLKIAIENPGPIVNYQTKLENCSEKPTFCVSFIIPQGIVPDNILVKSSSQTYDLKNDQLFNSDSQSLTNSNNLSSSASSQILPNSSRLPKLSNSHKIKFHSENFEVSPLALSKDIESCPIFSDIASTASVSHSNSLFDSSSQKGSSILTLPFKMDREKYNELEGKIDNLLAEIINDDLIH